MKIAILGSNGQIGRELFKQLCIDFPDAEILACVRHYHLFFEGVTGNNRMRSISFDPLKDDWSVLKGADVLINCVGIIKETASASFENIHFGLTKKILDNRSLIGNPKIIQVSVLGADKNASSPFLSTKGRADDLLLQHERTYVIRPSIVCSHNTVLVQKFKLMKKISKFMLGTILFPAGFLRTKIQPVLVEDVCKVMSRLCNAEPEEKIINITGPEEITIKELIGKIDKVKVVPVSQKLFHFVYKLLYPLLQNVLSIGQYDLLLKDNTADSALAESITGKKMSSTQAFWRQELN